MFRFFQNQKVMEHFQYELVNILTSFGTCFKTLKKIFIKHKHPVYPFSRGDGAKCSNVDSLEKEIYS